MDSGENEQKNHHLRPLQAEQGLLNRADGSCRWSQGRTCVLVSVFGPIEVKQRKEILDRATIEVIYKPRTGIAGSFERTQEMFIRNTLEHMILSSLHPRTSISITVQVLEADGGVLSASINGTCLALLDAGIPLKSAVSACTCAMSKEGQLILDPTDKEEKESRAVFTFAFNNTMEGVVTSDTNGHFDQDEYFHCLEAAKLGCAKMFTFIRGSIENRYQTKI